MLSMGLRIKRLGRAVMVSGVRDVYVQSQDKGLSKHCFEVAESQHLGCLESRWAWRARLGAPVAGARLGDYDICV